MTKRSFAPAAALLAVLAWPAGAMAQDAHYWTYGYGPVGQLTEGTLVGGVEDLSAIFYNPGALALIDEPRFLFGLTSIELATIKAPNAGGPNLDFDSFVFDIVPSVVAGRIGKNEGEANQFAFAFLSRHDTDWDLGYSNARVSAASPDGSAGFGRVRQRVVEYWVGGTWSHRVSESLAFGVSPFVAYRAQRSRRSLDAGGPGGRHVARGLRRKRERVQPRAAARQARPRLAARPVGARRHGDHRGRRRLELRQGGLQRVDLRRGLDAVPLREHPGRARRHVPLPVVGGGRARRGAARAPRSTPRSSGSRPSTPTTSSPRSPPPWRAARPPSRSRSRARAESIVNFGVGLEHQLSERFTLYGGAARNASAWTPESETLASWDLVDVTGGISLDRGSVAPRARHRLRVGQRRHPPGDRAARRDGPGADDRGDLQPLDDLARRVVRGQRPVGRGPARPTATCSTRRSSGSGPRGRRSRPR